MATVDEEIKTLLEIQRAGRGAEKIHIVRFDELAREREKNASQPKPKTIFRLNTHSGNLWFLFNKEKDRIIRRVGNLTIALDMMLRAWQELTDDKIRSWLSEGE